MNPFFVPQRLQRVRKKVNVLHKNMNDVENIIDLSVNEELKYLIKSLVEMDESDLAIEAFALSDLEICRIAGYLPYNYFDVDMKNLFRIFLSRSEERFCDVLYRQWQNSYCNESCNAFLHILLKNDDAFKKYTNGKHIKPERMDSILLNSNIALGIGAEVMRYPFTERKTLAEKFDFFGISETSKLYEDCENVFYTFCRKEDYKEADENELLNIIKKYEIRNQPLLKTFLFNFLNRLKLTELIEFRDLAKYFWMLAGDARTPKEKYKFLFVDMPEELFEKYMNWLNRCRIEQYFGNDDRSEFWKQYRFINVEKYNRSNAIVMEFEKYVAVEFLGQASGPAYFYPKDYFKKVLRGQFMILENLQMRHYLLHKSDYDKKEDRKEHHENWQYKVDDYIIKHHVTRKIFE